MGLGKVKNALKLGMGGSRCGRNRSEKTEIMKDYSHKLWREFNKKEILEQEIEFIEE